MLVVVIGGGGGGGGGDRIITFYCTCIGTYTGKVILIHSLLFVLNFMLTICPHLTQDRADFCDGR